MINLTLTIVVDWDLKVADEYIESFFWKSERDIHESALVSHSFFSTK